MVDLILFIGFIYALGLLGFAAYDWYTLKAAGLNTSFLENVTANYSWPMRLLQMWAAK